MITRYLLIFTSLFALFACDQLGSSRISNLIDLTPPLSVDNEKPVSFNNVEQGAFNDEAKIAITFAQYGIISAPEFAKKTIYVSDKRGFVSAYSLKEQKQLWCTDIKGDVIDRFFMHGGILYSNGKLYVTNGTKYLVILDAETGIEEFRKEFSDIIRAKPVIADNKILIQTVNNKLYAINSSSFKTLWVHEGGIQTINSNSYVHPMLFEEMVIASFNTGELLALDINTGTPRWRYSLTSNENITLPGFVPATIRTQPIIYNDFIYFATGNGRIVRLYLYTGLPVWSKKAHDVHSMALHSGKLIVTNNARQVAVMDASNGEINWVGNLITQELRQKRKVKPVQFLTPFVTKAEDNSDIINVAGNDGILYRFRVDNNNNFPVWPETSQIIKEARYQWLSCCDGQMHFITDSKIELSKSDNNPK